MKVGTNELRISRAEALNVAQAAREAATARVNAAAKAVRDAAELTASEVKVDELQQLTRERYMSNRARLSHLNEPGERMSLVETLNALLDDEALCEAELAAGRKRRELALHKAQCESGTARQQYEKAKVEHEAALKRFNESFPVLEAHS